MTVVVTSIFMLAGSGWHSVGWVLGLMQLAVRPEIRRRNVDPSHALWSAWNLYKLGVALTQSRV
jgi:hypothetical protein